MIKKRFGIKRQLSAAAAVCMLIQPAAVIAQDPVVQDTVINEGVSDGWLESSKQALLTDSETGTLSPNYLSGLNPKSFSPTIGKDNDGYSTSKDSKSLKMTDGIRNKQWEVWFIKFPSKAKELNNNYPFVSYELDSQQSVNTVKIFAGRDAEELDKINEKLKSDKISVFVKESADWKEVKINTSEEYDTENKCQLVTIQFAPEKASEIKLEFQEGTGIVGDKDPNNTEGFRIREIELYNDSTYVPEPEPEPDEKDPNPDVEWKGIYDYNINNSATFGLAEDKIKVSGGELTAAAALVDGKSTSAAGNGKTKWFVQNPTGKDYAEFTLDKKTVIAKAMVCSGNQKDSDPNNLDILTNFSVQYMDENGDWVTAASFVNENNDKVAEVSFSPVASDKFRIYTDTMTRFRIREISLDYPEIRGSIRVPEYVDLTDGAKATAWMKGETDKDLKVEILLNGEVTDEFTKLESKYKIDIKPKNEGKNVLAVQIYLKENETDTDYTLIGTAKTEFFVLDIKDQDTMGYHPFTDGLDNGAALNAFGVGSNHASIEQGTDGNYYMKATKGTAAASGDPGDYRYWQYFNPAGDGINTYWNEQSAYKFMSIEFDIRTKAAMTATDRIYFSARHQYQNGLQIFGMDSETVAMGEPEADRAFKEITNLTPNQWYHYTYILDVNNKKAKAVLSDGTNEYKVDWKALSGDGQGYWKDNLSTPFEVMAFQLPGGEIDLDNIMFKKYYPAPTVNADSIVIKSDDDIQADWGKVSALTNKIEIDFSAPMNEATVNNNSIYVTAKGDTAKINATGALVSGKYVLTLNEALSENTEYELHITTDVQNIKGETFGTEAYTAGFKTVNGELNVKLNSVKASDGTPIDTLSALKLLGGQKVKINIDYTNTLQSEREYNIIVTHFAGDEVQLAGAEIINVKHDAAISKVNEDIEYTVPTNMDNITTTKVFCWGDFETITPLASPIELK